MLLYMIRHGQSEANAAKIHSGWGQYKLTERGEEDARGAREKLCGIKFDKVYTSDLVRAMRTREIALPEAEAEVTELIRERDVGSLVGMSPDACREKYGEIYVNARASLDFSPFGGESLEEHRERVEKFLKILEADPCERVAAFCHHGTLLRMYNIATKTPSDDRPSCKNCCIAVFEYSDGEWSLKEWDI